MKFSAETLAIMKNFAAINPGLLINPGNELRTVHPQRAGAARAEVSETFEKTACIHNLTRFLAVLSLFRDPDVEFGDNKFIIRGDRRVVRYMYASENVIVSPPRRPDGSYKEVVLSSIDMKARVTWAEMSEAIKAAGVLGVPNIAFRRDSNGTHLAAIDSKGAVADAYSVTLSNETPSSEDETSAEYTLKIENLKLMPFDYDVAITKQGVARFTAPKLEYFVTLERGE